MRYRLADATRRVPMPERGAGVFFTADTAGEAVNPMNPYYARMIADGDLVPAEAEPTKAEPEKPEPEKASAPLVRNSKTEGSK